MQACIVLGVGALEAWKPFGAQMVSITLPLSLFPHLSNGAVYSVKRQECDKGDSRVRWGWVDCAIEGVETLHPNYTHRTSFISNCRSGKALRNSCIFIDEEILQVLGW